MSSGEAMASLLRRLGESGILRLDQTLTFNSGLVFVIVDHDPSCYCLYDATTITNNAPGG